MNLTKFAPSRFTNPFILGLAFLLIGSMVSISFAQDRGREDRGRERKRGQFDVEAYLKGLDSNNNGILEDAEMNDRTKGYIRKLGVDTNRPVSIKKVVGKINKDKKDREKAASKKAKGDVPLNIEGFGIDPEEAKTISTFGPSATGTSSSAFKKTYSDSVWSQVNGTLASYDRNKDGVLDADEIRRPNWGSPKPSENDLNKDGKLSKLELAKRYDERESYAKKQAAKTSSSTNKIRDLARKRAADREKYRSSNRSSTARTSSASTRTRTPSASSSSKSDAASREKYRRYASSLIETYDKDSDGKLSKEELGKMRRPPIGADANKDGFVTDSELLDNLTNANKAKSSSSSTAKTEKSSSKSGRKSSRDRGTYGSSSSKNSGGTGNSSFDKMDENENKRVEMHEFSDDWNDEKVKEFYAKDKNSDGVITLQEWSGR